MLINKLTSIAVFKFMNKEKSQIAGVHLGVHQIVKLIKKLMPLQCTYLDI